MGEVWEGRSRRIWTFVEDRELPGRYILRRHRVPVGEIRFDMPRFDTAIRLAAYRLMVEDAVRLWDNAARSDGLWINED